jgi:hypothetical protein
MGPSAQDEVLLRQALPQTAALLACLPTLADDLVGHAAASSFTTHPLLSLLWSRPTTPRTTMLDTSVGAIAPTLPPQIAKSIARRIAVGRDFRDATAALTELLVAGLFANTGATVSFVPCARSRVNDLTVSRDGGTVHVEVASLNISDDNERTETGGKQGFAA